MRTPIIVGLAVLGLTLGACDGARTPEAAAQAKVAVRHSASREDLAQARAEVEQTAKDAGAAVTAAAGR